MKIDRQFLQICGTPETYCGHPRQCGLHNFGNGHLALLHWHAPCSYREQAEVGHSSPGGVHSRSVVLLQRSFDGGRTWRGNDNVVVWDEAAPLEQRKARLSPSTETREHVDMTRPESILFFGRTGFNQGALTIFALRSADQGRRWEAQPTVLTPPPGCAVFLADNYPTVRLPDGSLLHAMSAGPPIAGVVLYGSKDNGLSWTFRSVIGQDPSGTGRMTYANLLRLPNGRLQCTMLNIGGRGDTANRICLSESDDAGSWSPPRPIVPAGTSPWDTSRFSAAELEKRAYAFYYRSPWPLVLADGRIVLFFAHRQPPSGIGLMVSEDLGKTWGEELILRDDGASDDLGYPVATQLDDGTIFVAYYYVTDPSGPVGGPRHIAGSRVRLTCPSGRSEAERMP